MSSILKALKKVENERANRQTEALKIDSDILRPDTKPGYSAVSIIAAAFLLTAVGSAGTYLFMRAPEKHAATAELSPASPQLPQHPTVPPAAVIPLETLPPAIVAVPSQKSTSERARQQLPASTKHVQKAVTVAPGREASTARQEAELGKNSATAPEASPRPALRVTGIAWQNSSADSLAIINGVPVSNGKVIEGARVEAIQKDRVRLSYHGEQFEIPLGQSSR